MSKVSRLLLAVSAVVLFSASARAGEKVLLALNTPPKSSISSISTELKAQATAQALLGATDFDAFSAVNDPLYRESSKELLKQEIKNDAGKTNAAKESLRDAPISKEALPGAARPVKVRPLLKKPGAGKPLHADPVKVKNTI